VARRGLKVTSVEAVPNQVFLGVPWFTIRPKYERMVERLRTKSPLSFVIVGRGDAQDAEDLLEIIKERLTASSYAVFDATGGNANVSLEFGFAEAHDIPRALYYSTHKAAHKGRKDFPIIADLAGKRRNQYTQEAKLLKLLQELSARHPYAVRFERFLRTTFARWSKGDKKRARALCLKIIHCLDGVREVRRADIVQRLLADVSRYDRREIDQMILTMHQKGLIQSQQGPHARVRVA